MLVCACTASAHSSDQRADAAPLASTTAAEPFGTQAPNYNSDYTQGSKDTPSSNGNTPEDDARPGEYYFHLGVDAFLRKDYLHAVKMYEVAASWAYKPAQFNLGVIYARGQGVPADLPRAMAWMALAAERNDKEYVDGRELVYGLLTEEQFAQANAIWRELKKTCGDEVALARAKARWAEVRQGMTGSHVGANAGPLLVGTAPPHLAKFSSHQGSSAADIISGDRADGSIAYRQLRESDNPYDPKFERPALGIATVEPLQPLQKDGKVAPEENSQH